VQTLHILNHISTEDLISVLPSQDIFIA